MEDLEEDSWTLVYSQEAEGLLESQTQEVWSFSPVSLWVCLKEAEVEAKESWIDVVAVVDYYSRLIWLWLT